MSGTSLRRRDRERAAEHEREVAVHAEVDDRRPHAGDAQRRGERPTLEPDRRQRVRGTDHEGGDHRRGLQEALGQGEHDRQDGGDGHDPPCGRRRELPGRERQVRLVDPVDIDVGELVDADDRDVHAGACDQHPEQLLQP
jgi:hypothetical protein